MSQTVHRRLSPGRLTWLQHLMKVGIANRPRGRVGRDCMRLGWTEWAEDAGGKFLGERITAAGIEALAKETP